MERRDCLPGFAHFADTDHLRHPSHARIGVHPLPDKLYVVTMLENPLRWRTRYKNYWQFAREVECAGAELHTAEIAFRDRPFEVTEAGNPKHLQLRCDDELWHKENALNLLIQRLPADAKYVAWIDSDVSFARGDWVQETIHLLQHYDFIQMWSVAVDLNSNDEPLSPFTHKGFMAQYIESLSEPYDLQTPKKKPSRLYAGSGYEYEYGDNDHSQAAYWHPGFAWAARIDALEKVGMLIDWAILGSGDWHMAWGLIGQILPRMTKGLSQTYKNWCVEWERRAEREIKRNVGYMPGMLLHHFHGQKKKRRYNDRWKFLIDSGYDPALDIKRDRNGLWQLSGHNQALRDGLRVYNRWRDEDEFVG